MSEQNVTMTSGDSLTMTIAITDETGAPFDVSTATAITWALGVAEGGPSFVRKELGAGVEVDGATVRVSLTPFDTEDLEGVFQHELEIRLGGQVGTVLAGRMTIAADLIST